jgi:hypothetical protein
MARYGGGGKEVDLGDAMFFPRIPDDGKSPKKKKQ